jgi:hypothetical protein
MPIRRQPEDPIQRPVFRAPAAMSSKGFRDRKHQAAQEVRILEIGWN